MKESGDQSIPFRAGDADSRGGSELRKKVAGGLAIIFVTAASEQEAASISRALVDEGLAACANIIPQIRSIYRWQGKVWDERETLIIIKSREDLFERIRRRVKELHSYEVPEITAVKLDKGDSAYLKWIESVTTISKGD